MWRLRLIRFRLTLLYTLLLAGAFAIFSAGIIIGLNNAIYDSFYQNVQQAAGKIVSSYRIEQSFYSYPTFGVKLTLTPKTVGGDLNAPAFYKYGFLDANGNPIAGANKPADTKVTKDPKVKQAISKVQVEGALQNVTVKGKSGDTNVLVVPTGAADSVAVFETSLQQTEDTVALMQRMMILAAAAMTIISAAGAWFLTGRALRPIDKMSEQVRRITVRDLSERLHLNQRDEIGRLASTFDDMISRLQAAFERQKRFTSDASHELRTPLTIMQADIDLALRRPRSSEEYRETLESAQEEVSRLSHIVSDLLTLTRLDTDVAFVEHEPVALDELIDSVVASLQPLARDKSIRLGYRFSAPVTIMGDVTRLKQLFINLLDNALNYTPAGGEVRVTLESTWDAIQATVSDTGMGIEPEHLPHIFERFYRADQARTRVREGTGLGLAIAKSAIQAHNGQIDVTSKVGLGTTFTITLPYSGVLAAEHSEMFHVTRPALRPASTA